MKKNLGLLLVGIWFILHGLMALVSFSFRGLGLVMGLLAIVAGALLVLGKLARSPRRGAVAGRPDVPGRPPAHGILIL
jgi:uncharacterized membrane-anchored protein